MASYTKQVITGFVETTSRREGLELIGYSLLETEQFTFLVGPDHKRLNIHPGVLEHHSDPLHALISNGQMRESKEKVAVLEDIDVETFSLLAEYCYTGNYHADPRPKVTSPGLQQRQPTSMAQPDTTVAVAYVGPQVICKMPFD